MKTTLAILAFALAVPAWGQQPVAAFLDSCPAGWTDVGSGLVSIAYLPIEPGEFSSMTIGTRRLTVEWCIAPAGKTKPHPQPDALHGAVQIDTDSNCTGLENMLCFTPETPAHRPKPDASGVVWTREPVTQLVPSCREGQQLEVWIEPMSYIQMAGKPDQSLPCIGNRVCGGTSGHWEPASPKAQLTDAAKYRCVPIHPTTKGHQ